MKHRNMAAIAALLGTVFLGAIPAAAAVLTFDDLGSGKNFFLGNYDGFQFGTNNIADTAWFHTDEASPFYKPASGSNYIATDYTLYTSNPFGPTQAISRSTEFIFDGAYFTGGDNIVYQLYLNNALVYTSAGSGILTSTPAYVASGYGGPVDSVVIVGHQGFYALDNFTYSDIRSSAPVPEPASWAMMVGGFGLIGATVRRKKVTVSFA